MSEHNEKDILRKYSGLRRAATRIFGSQLGEDAAQESIVSILEGKNIHQKNYYALTDAVRKSRVGAYLRRNGTHEPSQPNVEWDDSALVYENGSGPDIESEKGYRESLFTFIKLVSQLKKPRLIQVLILHETYQWTLKEISLCYGISESRVSQEYTLSKKLLKKIAISKGLSPSEQRGSKSQSSGVLPQEFKIIESLSTETLERLVEIQRTKNERKSQLAKGAFFKIPKAVFSFTRKNEIKDKTKVPRMAKIKLERESFICPRMAKTTINFWPQKSH